MDEFCEYWSQKEIRFSVLCRFFEKKGINLYQNLFQNKKNLNRLIK